MLRVLSTLETDSYDQQRIVEAQELLLVKDVDKDFDIAVNDAATSWKMNQWILKGNQHKLEVHKPINLNVEAGDMVEISETNYNVTGQWEASIVGH